MKHKLFLILIGLLIAGPSLASGYNPTNGELRSTLFDYIGTQSQRQQYQDILDAQNSSYQQLFNTYNQSTSNLDREFDLKLKELELQKDAQERAESWEQEKQIIDQQLELIRQMNELEAERKAFEIEKNSQDLIKFGAETAEQIRREKDLNESLNIIPKKKQSLDEIFGASNSSISNSGSPEINALLESLQKEAISASGENLVEETLPPKRNIFHRFWKSITSIF